MIDEYWKSILGSDAHKEKYTSLVAQYNKEVNGYIEFDPQKQSFVEARNKYRVAGHALDGVPFAIKNNIALEGNMLSCASELLSNFESPITATAVQQLLETGLVPVGLTNMDEFGMGADTTHTIYGQTHNPWDLQRTVGGSSGGSAAAVSAGTVPFALGSDTGGSVRQPAGFCGIWGFKPTYGAVSRYGLVAFASSLDVIGVLAEHPKWLEIVFNAMRVRGKDVFDASAYYPNVGSLAGSASANEKSVPSAETKKIAMYIPPDTHLSDKVVNECLDYAKKIYEKKGYEITRIDIPIYDYSPAVYSIISSAEASTNLARFDGIRYGKRGAYASSKEEIVRNARSKGFGDEVKLRILTGGFVLRSGFQDQFYVKAQRLRAHIRNLFTKMFESYDIVITPVTTTQAFRLHDKSMDSFQQKLADTYSVVANLAGIPALSYPVFWRDGLPMGIQAMAPHYAEQRLFNFANDNYELFEHRYSPYARKLFEETGRKLVDTTGSDSSKGDV